MTSSLKININLVGFYKKCENSIKYLFTLYLFNTASSAAPSDYTVSGDAGIEPNTVATSALAVEHFNHSARSHPRTEKKNPKKSP